MTENSEHEWHDTTVHVKLPRLKHAGF